MGLLGLLRRDPHERVGFELYGAAVRAARDPVFYRDFGVPDTLDGRFDMVTLFTFLLIRRLTADDPPGPAVAQAVFDAMFSDMDVNLREMGVGDLSVGRKMKVMWEAFHGRSAAYGAALAAGDTQRMEAALARNVWRDATPPDGATASLRRAVLAVAAGLAAQELDSLVHGQVVFPRLKDMDHWSLN